MLHNLNDYQDIIHFFQKEFNKVPSVSELSISGVKEELNGRISKNAK